MDKEDENQLFEISARYQARHYNPVIDDAKYGADISPGHNYMVIKGHQSEWIITRELFDLQYEILPNEEG